MYQEQPTPELSHRISQEESAQQYVNEIAKGGYVVVQIGELLTIKEVPFKVERFDKKSLAVSTKTDLLNNEFLTGDIVRVQNNGFFDVKSVGKNWVNLRAKASTHIFDRVKLEKMRKKTLNVSKADLLKEE